MQRNSKIISRLTALWALSEAGLGGILHALQSPFTGLFVGGFAIILISLIAYFADDKWETIFHKLRRVNAPTLVIGEMDRTTALLRDIYHPKFNSIIVRY